LTLSYKFPARDSERRDFFFGEPLCQLAKRDSKLLQKAFCVLGCFETSKLRFGIGHFHGIAAPAPGIEAVFDRAGFLNVNFCATHLIGAAPYLTAFQSHRLLLCGSVVVSAKKHVRQQRFWGRGVSA